MGLNSTQSLFNLLPQTLFMFFFRSVNFKYLFLFRKVKNISMNFSSFLNKKVIKEKKPYELVTLSYQFR